MTNPAVPVPVSGLDTPGQAKAVVVSGNYAYIADGEAGFQVVNVAGAHESGLGWWV
ncbi:MAG: hypothetical protein RMH97_08490 [Verrucomicrobiales bacterium]|nr:hypothetical protein [Verrucomicrobiales bacterium]